MEAALIAILALVLTIAVMYVIGVFDCPENRGHHYGPISDLCLNDGCNAERGSWSYCGGRWPQVPAGETPRSVVSIRDGVRTVIGEIPKRPKKS